MIRITTCDGVDTEIRFIYDRFARPAWLGFPSPIRGVTECELTRAGVLVAVGHAHCTVADQWRYETGRRLALRKAIYCLPRDVRKDIWSVYFLRKQIDRIRQVHPDQAAIDAASAELLRRNDGRNSERNSGVPHH